jgi:hypothetical protein
MTATHPNTVTHAPTVSQPRWLRLAALLGAVAYLLGVSAYLLTHGGWPTPDYLIPPLLLVAVALGKGPAFLADWGPFLVIVLAWQASAGVADTLGRPVHITEPLAAERALFGGYVPTVELQRWLYRPEQGAWYDWVGVIQHSLHFVLPVAVGFWLWLGSRRLYWHYLAAVLLLFFTGFAIYALYPAAPPWMAGMNGLTPPVHRIAIETVLRLPPAAPIGLAYTHMNPNPVAAIPSLHAALPMLIALILIRVKGTRALPALLYPLVMGFYLVYLGEHYVVDVLAGFACAQFAYLVAWEVPWDRLAGWVVLPRVALPRLLPEPALHRLGTALMPALAVAAMAVIGFSLRPGRPADTGPLVPGLQVAAGDVTELDPQPCGSGASPSLKAGTLLHPIAGRYAAYLFDPDAAGCYVLTANTGFSPPSSRRVVTLAEQAPVRMQPVPSVREGVEYYSVYSGLASDSLLARGFSPERRYVLLAALAEVADVQAAGDAVEALASLAFAPVGPRLEPEGEPEPPTGAAPAEEPPAPEPAPAMRPATPTVPLPESSPSDAPAEDGPADEAGP